MTTSFIAADANSLKISCSVAFKWYIVHRQSVFICQFGKKMPFALGEKGEVNKYFKPDKVSLHKYSAYCWQN